MDRLIWISWRAFWVGLGASLVLIIQSLASSSSLGDKSVDPMPVLVAPMPLTPTATPGSPLAPQRSFGSSPDRAKAKAADPVLSRFSKVDPLS